MTHEEIEELRRKFDAILDMEVKELPDEFYGKGEVRGFHFTKVVEHEDYYIFKVNPVPNEKAHYELIERIPTPICLDFENKVYSETKCKERFPKAKDFGVWAWTYSTFNAADESAKNKYE